MASSGAPLSRQLARWIANGFGSGLAPVAPGTVGSLVALLLGAILMRLSAYAIPVAALAATLAGWWAVRSLAAGDDPGWVVIDEFAGQWIALLGIARANMVGLLVAFLLFRLLDISKPGPIGWIDRNKSAVGVMGDDVLAGLLAAAILWAVRAWWPGLLDDRS